MARDKGEVSKGQVALRSCDTVCKGQRENSTALCADCNHVCASVVSGEKNFVQQGREQDGRWGMWRIGHARKGGGSRVRAR